MQDCRRQLSSIWSIALITITAPLVIWLLSLLEPTVDDWSYLTNPWNGRFLSQNILPVENHWRPFDAVIGYILSRHISWFPTLNHLLVFVSHFANTILLFRFLKKLGYHFLAANLSTFFFYLSPAMLGTVLGIDSMNQSFSHFLGLLGCYYYFFGKNQYKEWIWIGCVILAVCAKENGIVWGIIPPILAFGFGRSNRKHTIKNITIGFTLFILYFIARYILSVEFINTETSAYFDYSLFQKIKHIAIFIGMTWLPVDYVSIVYPPSRNWWLILITVFLSVPYLYLLFIRKRHFLTRKEALYLFLCMMIAISPHLATIVTAMHPYASLGLATMLMAFIINQLKKTKFLIFAYILFMSAAIITDYHHWIKSYESGMTGKRMAVEAINKTGHPVDGVYIIHVHHNEPKYSSFCVIPYDAFGWGRAALHETEYQYPKNIGEITIDENRKPEIPKITKNAFRKGYQSVWLIEKDNIEVINHP